MKLEEASDNETTKLLELRTVANSIATLVGDNSISWLQLQPWQQLVERYRSGFGDCWAVARIAVVSAGIKSSEPGEWDSHSWSQLGNIVSRTRFARLKSGNINWWRAQLKEVASSGQDAIAFASLTFLIWGTPRLLAALSFEISNLVDQLDKNRWQIVQSVTRSVFWSIFDGSKKRDSVLEHVNGGKLSLRIALVVANRGNAAVARAVYDRYFQKYAGAEVEMLNFSGRQAFEKAQADPSQWPASLRIIKHAYLTSGVSLPRNANCIMPPSIAISICQDAQSYPEKLVNLAQSSIAAEVGASVSKIDDVADTEGWFH